MTAELTHRPARAELTVLVSRHAPGDLAAGVRDRLESLDPVAAVEEFDVTDLRPGLNDLTVEVTADMRLAADAPAAEGAAAERLLEGFGVREATVEFTDGRHPPP